MSNQSLFIAISGLIGAGKTTLAEKLAEKMDLPIYYEPVTDNVYLEDFYNDMEKYSFPLQIYLLNKRFAQHQQIIWSNRGGIADRSIYEDKIFAKMLNRDGKMDSRDYETYVELFSNISNFMKRPDLIVYLDVTPEESLERIKIRNRSIETSVSLEYLESLYQGYMEFIEEIGKSITVIKIPWHEFKDEETVADKIIEEYNKISQIRKVEF